jgi:hypothetical protein
VARNIHHASIRKRLTVGACATAANGKYAVFESSVARYTGDAYQILNAPWKDNELWKKLVNRVVGRRDDPISVVRRNVPLESAQPKFCNQVAMRWGRDQHIGNAGEHVASPSLLMP